MSSSSILFLIDEFNFNCCEEYESTIPAFILIQMHVRIPSENLLVKSIWFDKALVAISSTMNNFTKQVYHLWGRSQDCPIRTKINRKIQVRKQGISSKWKSSRDIIFLTLILVPYGKCSLPFSLKYTDMDHLHTSHLLQIRHSDLHPHCKTEWILLGN